METRHLRRSLLVSTLSRATRHTEFLPRPFSNPLRRSTSVDDTTLVVKSRETGATPRQGRRRVSQGILGRRWLVEKSKRILLEARMNGEIVT